MESAYIYILVMLYVIKGSHGLDICDSKSSRRTQELQQGNFKFYLSPCKQNDSVKAQELCDPDYAACITKTEGDKEVSFIRSLGAPAINKIEEGYSLYFKGPPCNESAEATILVIKFICDYGLYQNRVSLLKSPDVGTSCIYVFLWLSPSACPRTVITSVRSFDACTLHVKDINHTVNLNNMIQTNKSFAISATPDRQYILRLCSGVPKDDGCEGSILCLTDRNGLFISDLGFGMQKAKNWTVEASHDYWMTNMTLVYESYEAIIHFNFLCTKDNPSVQFGSERMTSKNKQFVIFNVFTKQACSVNVAECPILDDAITYDLRGLILKEWTLDNMSVTLCRPNRNCPHENEVICSEDGKISAYMQNAELHVELMETLEQSFKLTYITNEVCGTKNGSISFLFQCHEENLNPTLLETKDDCHHYAIWQTPFVCLRTLAKELDLHLHTGVNKCIFGDLGIDLSPLYNEEGDIIVYDSVSNSSWAVNICGRGLWGGSTGTCGPSSAVCKLDTIPSLQDRLFPSKKSHNGTSIGENNLISGLKVGQVLSLIYSSGRVCESDPEKNVSAAFTFVCGAEQKFSKPIHEEETIPCQDKFMWSTHLVCPVESISCEIDGPSGSKIDIGVLSGSRIEDDIIVRHDGTVFVMDICKELEGSKLLYSCPVNSAACMMVSENGTSTSFSLGELRNAPYYNSTSDEVYLDYVMGSLCLNDSDHQTHYSTRIIFKCDWGRKFLSVEFVGQFGCQYRFLAVSDAACPRHKKLTANEGCFISGNPDFPNEIVDFSRLVDKNSSLIFKESNGDTFHINICNSLPGNDAFAAMMNRSDGKEIMLGRKSETVQVVDKVIYIEYTDGDKCEDDPSMRYSVIIRFVCPRFDSPVYLHLIEKGLCLYIFNVYTSFVCAEHRGRCGISTFEGHHYDFSPLIKPSDSSYVVDDSWHINVCQSVESCGVVGEKSHPVSVCKVPSESKVMSQKFLINEKLQLIYEVGEVCPHDQNRTLSSIISFKCDPDRYPGYPRKKMNSDSCQIDFEFPTALACKNLSVPYVYTSRSCKFYHSGIQKFVDFSQVKAQEVENGWKLSPCPDGTSCTVCANGSSYGHVHSSLYDFQHESLIVENRGGSLCSENSIRRSSRIWFKCDRSLEKGDDNVRVLYQSPCFAEFEWTTNLVCIPFEYENEEHETSNVATSGSKFEGMIVIPIVLIILTGIGAVTYFKKEYGMNFLQVYRRRGFTSFVSYSRDLDNADGDESLQSVASSFNDENCEQYKMT